MISLRVTLGRVIFEDLYLGVMFRNFRWRHEISRDILRETPISYFHGDTTIGMHLNTRDCKKDVV